MTNIMKSVNTYSICWVFQDIPYELVPPQLEPFDSEPVDVEPCKLERSNPKLQQFDFDPN